MILNSSPWKSELNDLAEGMRSLKIDVDESDFCLERSLLYSALISRVLVDSGKVTDRIKGLNMSVRVAHSIDPDIESRLPLLNRFLHFSSYDFSNLEQITVPCRSIANQIIHSYTLLIPSVDEEGGVDGFLLSSDRNVYSKITLVQLADWLNYLDSIIKDDVTTFHAVRDEGSGKWKVRIE